MLEVLHYLLVFVEVVSSSLLLGIILIQKTRSQGMGLAFGSGMGESLFGSQMGNVLTRTTVWLAAIFLLNTTFLAIIGARSRRGSVTEGFEAEPLPAAAQSQTPGGVPPMQAPELPVDQEVPNVPAGDVPLPTVVGQPGAVETIPQDGTPLPEATTPAVPLPETPAPTPETPAPAPETPAPAPETPAPDGQ